MKKPRMSIGILSVDMNSFSEGSKRRSDKVLPLNQVATPFIFQAEPIRSKT